MARLVLSLDGQVMAEYNMNKERYTIGRLPDNDIRIDNAAVSGHHSLIINILNDSFLEDLNSTNGTYVNGKLIKKHALQHGDVITVGHHQLRFVEDDTLARKAMATEWSTLGLKPVIVQQRGDPVPDVPVGPRLLMGMHAAGDAMPAVAGDWAAATPREDPRLVMDLLRLCRDTKRREKFGYLLAVVFTVPGLWLIATGQSSAAIFVLAALVGLVGVIANAQLLGFVTATATEVDEEE